MSAGPNPTGNLTYTRSDTIALPQSDAEKRFAIRMSDWQRLGRYVSSCKQNPEPSLAGWYFLFFGISGSAILTIIPLGSATGLPAWVVPAYVCVAVATLVLALALVTISKWLRQQRNGRLDELQEEMSEIEAGFRDVGPLGELPTVASSAVG